jgi:deoxyribonuclease V
MMRKQPATVPLRGTYRQVSDLIACVDAAYTATLASAACALSAAWDAAAPTQVLTWRQDAAAPYESGAFYKRELPLLLGVLRQAEDLPATIVIDGYVWLDGNRRPGLGAILHEALAGRIPIVGIAKTSFGDAASWCIPVARGSSRRPLFVSAVGMAAEEAARHVRGMHGRHRVPTLLQLADRAARGALR